MRIEFTPPILAGAVSFPISFYPLHPCSLPPAENAVTELIFCLQREIERRRRACIKIYDTHLSTDEQLIESSMASLLSHFRGMLPYSPMERGEEE